MITETTKVRESNDPFKSGDVVHLNCGGPLMTLGYSEINPSNGIRYWTCMWFDNTTLNQGDFPEQSLTRTDLELEKLKKKASLMDDMKLQIMAKNQHMMGLSPDSPVVNWPELNNPYLPIV